MLLLLLLFKGYGAIRHSNTVALRSHDVIVILRHIASTSRFVASLKGNIVGHLDVVNCCQLLL